MSPKDSGNNDEMIAKDEYTFRVAVLTRLATIETKQDLVNKDLKFRVARLEKGVLGAMVGLIVAIGGLAMDIGHNMLVKGSAK